MTHAKRAQKNLINPPPHSSVTSVSVSFGKRKCCNVVVSKVHGSVETSFQVVDSWHTLSISKSETVACASLL